MTQIIRLPVRLAVYPETVQALDPPEHLLVMAIRTWLADYQNGNDPTLRLCDTMTAAGAPDAASSIDQFMTVAGRTAKRAIAIQCPRCRYVSPDEQCILHAASRAQHGDGQLAARALRTVLLSAVGAECAFDFVDTLAELFRFAGLRFRMRHLPIEKSSAEVVVEPWTPDGVVHTRH
jgi:hypothetical protein